MEKYKTGLGDGARARSDRRHDKRERVRAARERQLELRREIHAHATTPEPTMTFKELLAQWNPHEPITTLAQLELLVDIFQHADAGRYHIHHRVLEHVFPARAHLEQLAALLQSEDERVLLCTLSVLTDIASENSTLTNHWTQLLVETGALGALLGCAQRHAGTRYQRMVNGVLVNMFYENSDALKACWSAYPIFDYVLAQYQYVFSHLRERDALLTLYYDLLSLTQQLAMDACFEYPQLSAQHQTQLAQLAHVMLQLFQAAQQDNMLNQSHVDGHKLFVDIVWTLVKFFDSHDTSFAEQLLPHCAWIPARVLEWSNTSTGDACDQARLAALLYFMVHFTRHPAGIEYTQQTSGVFDFLVQCLSAPNPAACQYATEILEQCTPTLEALAHVLQYPVVHWLRVRFFRGASARFRAQIFRFLFHATQLARHNLVLLRHLYVEHELLTLFDMHRGAFDATDPETVFGAVCALEVVVTYATELKLWGVLREQCIETHLKYVYGHMSTQASQAAERVLELMHQHERAGGEEMELELEPNFVGGGFAF